jgi:perosamine synthetase
MQPPESVSLPARRIALSEPLFGRDEARLVTEAVETGWVASGEFIGLAEREFSQLVDSESTVAVSNGTDAILLYLLAMGVQPGDEVIVPTLGYVAATACVSLLGAIPVLADARRSDWTVDCILVEAAVGPRTVGIIGVDLYGHPCDYGALSHIAQRNGLWLLADAAESLGAVDVRQENGAKPKTSTYSFFGNKLITCGEGGAITTSDSALFHQLISMRNHALIERGSYEYSGVSLNFRLSNLSAALLLGQIRRFSHLYEIRHQLMGHYRSGLANRDGIELQPALPGVSVAPWLQSILLPSRDLRDSLRRRLRDRGIETRPFFTPMHRQRPFIHAKSVLTGVADDVSQRGLNLPLHPHMTASDVDYVIEGLVGV